MAVYRINVDDEESAFLNVQEADSLPALRTLYNKVKADLDARGRHAWLEAVRVNPDGTETIIENLMVKVGPGRPVGSVKPEGCKETHGITISDEAWDKAKATGNASQYIERLIAEDK